jgi:hypothetical protein
MSHFVTIEERDCPEASVPIRVHTHDGRILTLTADSCPFSGKVVVETQTYITLSPVSVWTCPVCDTEHREEG